MKALTEEQVKALTRTELDARANAAFMAGAAWLLNKQNNTRPTNLKQK